MDKPYLNVDLLKRIRDHIAEEPRRFMMESYIHDDEVAPCGTIACIAGWAVALTDGVEAAKHGSSVPSRAATLLFNESPWSERPAQLFNEDSWPSKYRRRDGAITMAGDGGARERIALTARAVRLLDEVIARGAIWWAL